MWSDWDWKQSKTSKLQLEGPPNGVWSGGTASVRLSGTAGRTPTTGSLLVVVLPPKRSSSTQRPNRPHSPTAHCPVYDRQVVHQFNHFAYNTAQYYDEHTRTGLASSGARRDCPLTNSVCSYRVLSPSGIYCDHSEQRTMSDRKLRFAIPNTLGDKVTGESIGVWEYSFIFVHVLN